MKFLIPIIVFGLVITGCRKSQELPQPVYAPIPYEVDLPSHFPEMEQPADNPMTVQGVYLGRHLFWDDRLSGDNTMACADCHLPQYAFSDNNATSVGIDGVFGTRNSMVLQNLAWSNDFFWDGRAVTLEEQVLMPVEDPIEMHESWSHFMNEIRDDETYKTLFFEAFGVVAFDSTHAAKALAQFLRSMVSCNSKYDKILEGTATFTIQEQAGFDSFNALSGGDCFHCHGGSLTTDFSYKNNGLDAVPLDSGRGRVTGDPADYFTFKVPPLRNLEYSAPYMHDGRFATIDEVINHYSVGLEHTSPNISPLMEFSAQGGVQLDPQERAELKAFLMTFSDPDFINNPDFRNPW
ncbi:cytochrome-c peroxidase [Parvicella tangerina]|uniref:cytochrome-c peroxidase n=1 Tax=Parvicella tangerina TaxID=2829795 RepID=UPI00215C46AC|nr:cytochrome c peroxidase [Parvicella tangerina]